MTYSEIEYLWEAFLNKFIMPDSGCIATAAEAFVAKG